MTPVFNADVLRMLMPLVIAVIGGGFFLMWGAFSRNMGRSHRVLLLLFHAALLGAITRLWNMETWPILNGALTVDRFALFFSGICTVCSLATVLVAPGYMQRFGIARSEFYSMLMFALAGMFVLVSATDLLSIFLGVELMSLALYVMVGYRRRDILANEAAMKYFLLGAFAIAFYLYGMSLLYGLCGTLSLKGIMLAAVDGELIHTAPFQLAMGLVLVGFLFKVAAVPFHMWVPDVYQGAASPVTGFMASAVKAAAFGALLRVLYMAFIASRMQWVHLIVVLSILTMTVGNITALVQRNIKRMLAYSSIAHAGYILVAAAAMSVDDTRGASAVMFYLLVYAIMTLGAFAVVGALERRGGSRGLELEDYAGLGWRRPYLGVGMAVLMISMGGIPGTAGFFAKYYAFGAAVEKGLVGLAIIGVLNSALALYYYLRVVVYMYMRKPFEEEPIHDDWGVRTVVVVTVLLTLWLGVGAGGVTPGIDNVYAWTTDSIARLVSMR